MTTFRALESDTVLSSEGVVCKVRVSRETNLRLETVESLLTKVAVKLHEVIASANNIVNPTKYLKGGVVVRSSVLTFDSILNPFPADFAQGKMFMSHPG